MRWDHGVAQLSLQLEAAWRCRKAAPKIVGFHNPRRTAQSARSSFPPSVLMHGADQTEAPPPPQLQPPASKLELARDDLLLFMSRSYWGWGSFLERGDLLTEPQLVLTEPQARASWLSRLLAALLYRYSTGTLPVRHETLSRPGPKGRLGYGRKVLSRGSPILWRPPRSHGTQVSCDCAPVPHHWRRRLVLLPPHGLAG